MNASRSRSTLPYILLVFSLLLLPASAVLAGSGQDAWGYTWIDSDEPGGPTYQNYVWTRDCAGTPCPDWTYNPGRLPWETYAGLPFFFPFYATQYNQVQLFDNGFLTFVQQLDYEDVNKPIPLNQTPDTLIALLWDDLLADLVERGEVNTTPRGYRIRMVGVMCVDDRCRQTSPYDMEVVLFEDGTFRVQYTEVEDNGSTTAGIEGPGGTTGIQMLYNGAPIVPPPGGRTELIVPGYVVEYTPPKPPDCSNAIPIACGQTIPSSTSPTQPAPPADSYACGGGNMLAYERVFTFTLTEMSWMRASVSAATDLRLFMMSRCDTDRCMVGDAASLDVPILGPGTYYLAVDGPTTGSNGPFDLTLDCGALTEPVSCGDRDVPGTTAGGLSAFDSYSCRSGDYSGPDRMYTVNLPAGGHLVATLNGPPELDVFLFEAGNLDPSACLGDGDVSAGAYGLPAGDYVIVVDGPAGSGAPFTLDVTCRTNMDCSTPQPELLTCNSTVSGSTLGGTTNVRRYSCDEDDYPGPEIVYRFSLAAADNVIVKLDTEDRLGVFLLQSCDEGDCAGGDDLAACTDVLPAGDYLLVVDSQTLAGGIFDLEVRCGVSREFDDWRQCENPSTGTSLDDTVKRRWSFNDVWYCPGSLVDVPGCKDAHAGCSTHRNTDSLGTYNGCLFAMYAVVECGTEFHLPLYDVESGRIKIYDVLREEYVYFYADTPSWSQEGTEICWIDSGCVDGTPCTAGSDDRYNVVMNDIRFFAPVSGDPVCGVFRLEFYEWGGFEWELYANCDGLQQEGFLIYDNVCDALRAYSPKPELSIVDPVVTGSCPNYTVEFELHNTGCAAAKAFHVEVWEDRPDPDPDILHHDLFVDELGGGESIGYNLPMNLQDSSSLNIVIAADAADDVLECSEASDTGSAVACFPQRGEHTFVTPICTDCLVNPVGAAVPPSVCAGGDSTLTAQGSDVPTCVQGLEYAWTTDPVPPPPADPAWDAGNRDVLRAGLAVDETWYLWVRCSDDIGCYNSDPYPVTISIHTPPLLPSAQAVDQDECDIGIVLSWDPATADPASGPVVYNVFRVSYSGNIAADCALAPTTPPVAFGFLGTSLLDIGTTANGEYVYVVQAEDSLSPTACPPPGTFRGGAVHSYCIAEAVGAPILDEVDTIPYVPDVGNSLLAIGGDQDSAAFLWADVRPGGSLRDFYRVFRSTRSTGPFEIITPPLTTPDFDDPDAPAILYFYDVRVVDTCGNVSEDLFPSVPPPPGCSSLELLCGRTLDADTFACEDLFTSHECFARDATGPDRMHSIRIQAPGNVTFRLTSSDMDQDLYVYDASLEECLDWGDAEVTLFDPAPGRYFVVVDGAAGQQGGYRLEVSCP